MNPTAPSTATMNFPTVLHIGLVATDAMIHRCLRSAKKSCGFCDGDEPHRSVNCYDEWNNCATYWAGGDRCYDPRMPQKCKKSCGFCDGDEPHRSVNCYDIWDDCATSWAGRDRCHDWRMPEKCKKSCGFCDGDEPHRSVTCYDENPNCWHL